MSEETYNGVCEGCGQPLAAVGVATMVAYGGEERDYCRNCHTDVKWYDPMPFNTRDLIVYTEKRGGHFFDRGTMGFFGSRLAPGVTPAGERVYFITSERDTYSGAYGERGAWDNERRYTIRYMTAGANIFTLGEFGEYDSLRQARAALKRHLKG